jgi:G3E family GTPase
VRSDLVLTIEEMLARRDAGAVVAFERIVIETSGLADPAPILHALMTAPGLAGRVRLAEVVTTVDAATGVATLAREAVSMKQVAVADRLLLTKADLTGGVPPELSLRLDELNATAPREIVIDGQWPGAAALGGRRDGDEVLRLAERLDLAAAARAHDAGDAHHLDGIVSFVIRRQAPLAAVALTLFLEALAEQCGSDLLRLKGLVAVAEHAERPAVVHGVQHVFHPLAWLEDWPSPDHGTRLVCITRGVSRGFVEALLAAIEAEVADVQGMPVRAA